MKQFSLTLFSTIFNELYITPQTLPEMIIYQQPTQSQMPMSHALMIKLTSINQPYPSTVRRMYALLKQ